MSHFKVKMHQIRFRLGLCPDPAYSAPPDPIAVFQGPTSKVRERKGREGRRGEAKGRKREGSTMEKMTPPRHHIAGYGPGITLHGGLWTADKMVKRLNRSRHCCLGST